MKRKSAAATALAVAICAAGLWWLALADGDTSGKPDAARSAQPKTGLGPAISQGAAGSTAVGGPVTPNLIKDSFLSPELRQTFEAMLFEAIGANEVRDPALLKKLLAALVPRYFPDTLAARATALLERYVDYRVALSELKPPTDPGDPRALRSALEARQSARLRHFTGEEYESLFAEEARLDRYTLARLEIERNSALTATQKQAALKETERELSDAQRAQRNQATAHLSVAEQTAALDARGASDIERFTQRRAQYGDEAATQLAQLDREDRDWQSRLNNYASAQAKKASPEQLQQLSQQLFSAQEQLRVEAALAARPQATPPATVQR